MSNVHSGHRDRLRKRYLESGLNGIEPHVILEMLLGYALPRSDTNPLGHALLDEFGSISAIFDAPIEELEKVKGMGEYSATMLKLIPDLCRVYMSDKNSTGVILNEPDKIGNYLLNRFIGYTKEVLYAVFMDNKCTILESCIICEGTIGRVDVDIRKIVQIALKYSATALVIAHNHPNNSALPSREDVHETMKLVDALKPLGITLVDHIIVSGDDYVSLAASSDYYSIFN